MDIEFDNEARELPEGCTVCHKPFNDKRHIHRAWEQKSYFMCSGKCYTEFLKFKGAIL